MKKTRKILRSVKGMTLMELMVGSLMFVMIAIAATAALSPMVMAFQRANSFAEYNSVLDSVANKITSDIARATMPIDTATMALNELTLEIRSEGTVTYTIASVGDDGGGLAAVGQLLRNDRPVFPQGFYKGKTVGFECNPNPDVGTGGYIVTVTVSSDIRTDRTQFGAEISREYAVLPIGAQQKNS